MSISSKKIPGFILFIGIFIFIHSSLFSQSKINYRKKEPIDTAIGYASFYANKFIGKKTASGEKFSQKKFTCAHNTFPMGTWVRITNLSNQLSVDVRVNDRLHHRNPRLVDLSAIAAKQIGFGQKGVIKVRVVRIKVLASETLPIPQ